MLENIAATEGEIHHKTTTGPSTPDHAVRDEFETIWRIAGLPPGDLGRDTDGTYQAAHAKRAWETYAATRDWHAVLSAAKGRAVGGEERPRNGRY